MDPDQKIIFDAMPLFRIYESYRIERFDAIDLLPASFDAATGITSKDKVILPDIGVSARLYLPKLVGNSTKKLPVIIYYHGGAFCLGSKSMSPLHNYLNSLVAKANVLVVSVDYRLAPEHPVPVAYDDSWLALQWVASHSISGPDAWLADHADFSRVYLAGDSAGANIAHNLAMLAGTVQLATNVGIKGLILLHPYFLQTELTESDAYDPKMSSGLRRLWRIVCPSSKGLDDHRINPMADGAPSLSNIGCDNVLVCVAGRDALRDRGRVYYERLKESGLKGKLELFEAEGEGHVFHVNKPTSEQALAQDKKICNFLSL